MKSRPLSERCLIGFGSTSGPPMLPVLYNNNYQIVQTPDAIMILVEMVHDVRVIRMNAQHEPPTIGKWLGDSVGHWEGDTLVVDTTNVNPHKPVPRSVRKFNVTERFKRVDPEHDSLSRHHRRPERTRSRGPSSIRSSRRPVLFMSTPAMRAITRWMTFSAARERWKHKTKK